MNTYFRNAGRLFWRHRLATLAWIGVAPAALAADPAMPPDTGQAYELQEVIVTAEFRKENLQDTPIAITAITGEMLAERGQTNLAQLGQQAPNVDIQPTAQGYGAAAVVSIRGIGQRDSSFAFEPGVGVYIDDVYFPTLLGNMLDLLDLDRVEILRGPQGTLAGKNSIGGEIKLFSTEPTAEPNADLQATFGSLNLARVQGATNLTLVPDTVYARISMSFKHEDGYLTRLDYGCAHPDSGFPSNANSDNCVLGTEGGVDELSLRDVVHWIASDRLDVRLIADFSHDNDEPTPNALISANPSPMQAPPPIGGFHYGPAFVSPNPYTSYATYTSPSNGWSPPINTIVTSWGTSANLNYKVSDNISLTSITSLRDLEAAYVEDTSASPFDVSLTYNPQAERVVTQELRLNANVLDAVDLTLGGFYLDSHASSTGRIEDPEYFDELVDDLIRSKNKSGFIHAVWHATKKLDLTAGIRYSDESKNYLFQRSTVNGAFSPFVSPFNGEQGNSSDSRPDYRAVIDYHWTDSLLTYLQYSTGFKGGGINPRPFYQNQVASFGPETLDTYEIGLKSDFLDKRAILNLAAFFSHYNSIQEQSFSPYFNASLPVQSNPALPYYNPTGGTAPSGVYENAGNAHMKGVEAELSAKPIDRLSINASLSYLDFNYVSLSPGAVLGGLTTDMTAPYSPKVKGSFSVQYEEVLGNVGSVTPRLDYSYQSSSYALPTNAASNYLSSYGLLNGRLSYSSPDRSWEASIAATNLTNKFYWVNKFDFTTTQGLVTGLPSVPREWAITIKRHF